MTPQFLAKRLAKMPAVKTYTSDGNLIRPKVNIEALRDLQKIATQLKIASQQKKLVQLQAFEKITCEQVKDYTKLREKAIDQKLGDDRLDLMGYIQEIEKNAAIISDSQNFGLNGYAQLYKKKFQFDSSANFDLEERKISEQIGIVMKKIRNRFSIKNNRDSQNENNDDHKNNKIY